MSNKTFDSHQLRLGEYLFAILSKEPNKMIIVVEVSEALNIRPYETKRLLHLYFPNEFETRRRGRFKLRTEDSLESLRDNLEILRKQTNCSKERL